MNKTIFFIILISFNVFSKASNHSTKKTEISSSKELFLTFCEEYKRTRNQKIVDALVKFFSFTPIDITKTIELTNFTETKINKLLDGNELTSENTCLLDLISIQSEDKKNGCYQYIAHRAFDLCINKRKFSKNCLIALLHLTERFEGINFKNFFGFSIKNHLTVSFNNQSNFLVTKTYSDTIDENYFKNYMARDFFRIIFKGSHFPSENSTLSSDEMILYEKLFEKFEDACNKENLEIKLSIFEDKSLNKLKTKIISKK